MVKLLYHLHNILKETPLPQPGHIVMLSPVLDATFSNPEAKKYEK